MWFYPIVDRYAGSLYVAKCVDTCVICCCSCSVMYMVDNVTLAMLDIEQYSISVRIRFLLSWRSLSLNWLEHAYIVSDEDIIWTCDAQNKLVGERLCASPFVSVCRLFKGYLLPWTEVVPSPPGGSTVSNECARFPRVNVFALTEPRKMLSWQAE